MTQNFSLAFALAGSAVILAGCQTTGAEQAMTGTGNPPAFVEAACGGCHAVEPPFLSPNPAVPTFEDIANRKGVTDESLGDWLANAHNYPEDMDFDLTNEQVEQIAAYVVTLRSDEYKPAE